MALTAAEQAELEQLQRELQTGQKPKGLSAAEIEELNQLQREVGQVQMPTATQTTQDAVGVAGRILDYPGGLIRTGVAGVAGVANTDDLKKAVKGEAPSSSEYLERGGVPEMGKVSERIPGIGGVTGRDVVGFGADVALDPATILSKALGVMARAGKGGKAVKAAEAIVNPIGRGAEVVGDKIYDSGFSRVDEVLKTQNKKPISQVLREFGRPTGTNTKLLEKMKAISDRMAPQRAALYEEADRLGAGADSLKAMEPAIEVTAKYNRNPGLRPMVGDLEEKVLAYGQEGKVPLSLMSEWKTSAYDALPRSAFDAHGKPLTPAKEFLQAQARGMKTEIEAAGNAARPGLGNEIADLNENWGTLLSARKPMAQEAKKGAAKNLWTSVDSAAAGYALAEPTTGIPLLAAKKMGDLSKTTWFRTNTGKLVNAAGKSDLLDPMVRQMIIESERPKKKTSSWGE